MRPALAALAALLVACGPAGFDAEPLEARFPELAGVGAHRLGDVRPYAFAADDALVLFLCRWRDDAPIPVSLPAEADPDALRRVRAALAAWEGAGLGVRFAEVPWTGIGIRIELREGMLAYAANTIADCAFETAPEPGAAVLPARLVSASVELARDDPRLAGSALHELGHALGFQGHVRRGESALVRETEAVRRAGERVLAGERFADATLAALYALPSGAVLARRALPPGTTRELDALRAGAAAAGLVGPLLRVGDREGRIAWLAPDGSAPSFRLSGLGEVLRRPERLRIDASPSARAWLEAR